jgi:hypothetical protein
MSVVGEPLVLISKISVTYVCGRILKLRVLLPQTYVTLILDTKTQGSPTTDIGDADFRY